MIYSKGPKPSGFIENPVFAFFVRRRPAFDIVSGSYDPVTYLALSHPLLL
jgi:hypothetical protein